MISRHPLGKQGTGITVLLQGADEIAEFQRSEEEGHALLAKLEWVAGEIARPCYSALQKQEIDNPKLVYGVLIKVKP